MKVIKNYENMNIMEDNIIIIIIIIIIILNISNINNIHLHVYIPLIYKQFNYIINSNLFFTVKFVGITPKKKEKKKGFNIIEEINNSRCCL